MQKNLKKIFYQWHNDLQDYCLDVFFMPSSVIAAMNYYPSSSTLRITFVSGTVYDYSGVPEKVFNKMKAFASKGMFFNRNIKGKYHFEKVK